MQGQLETCERPWQAINLAPRANLHCLNFLDLLQGWRTFWRALAQILSNFWRNYFACGKPELTFTYFLLLFIIKANDMMYFLTLFGTELYMFRQIYCPLSGVLILYSQQLVFVILL